MILERKRKSFGDAEDDLVTNKEVTDCFILLPSFVLFLMCVNHAVYWRMKITMERKIISRLTVDEFIASKWLLIVSFPFCEYFFKYLRKTVFFSVESAIILRPYLPIVFLW